VPSFNINATADLTNPHVKVPAVQADIDLSGEPQATVSPVAFDLPQISLGAVRVNVTLPDVTFQATRRLGGILGAIGGGGVGLDDAVRDILGTFTAHDFDDVARIQFGPMQVEVEPIDVDLGRAVVHGARATTDVQAIKLGIDLDKVQVSASTQAVDVKLDGKVTITGSGSGSVV
jgi:hypothetical protein